MKLTHKQFVLALTLLCSVAVGAQQRSDTAYRELLPLAAKARLAVVQHPTLAAFEIESTVRDAVRKAQVAMSNGAGDASSAARAILDRLEQPIGPLREIPDGPLQLLLARIAKSEGKLDEEAYHREYATALLNSVDRSGVGLDPLSAMRVVMIQEEYNWFAAMQAQLKPSARTIRQIDGHIFDVWTATLTSGGTREVYFDSGPMQDSLRRVLMARKPAPASTRVPGE
jgi:hypothetical protein